jgi:hypothetical protein
LLIDWRIALRNDAVNIFSKKTWTSARLIAARNDAGLKFWFGYSHIKVLIACCFYPLASSHRLIASAMRIFLQSHCEQARNNPLSTASLRASAKQPFIPASLRATAKRGVKQSRKNNEVER